MAVQVHELDTNLKRKPQLRIYKNDFGEKIIAINIRNLKNPDFHKKACKSPAISQQGSTTSVLTKDTIQNTDPFILTAHTNFLKPKLVA